VLDADFNSVPDAVVDFEHGMSEVTASFNFSQTGQVGYIQFRLSSSVAPSDVQIFGSTAPSEYETAVDVTLENSDGSAGCDYTLASNGIGYKGCWGGFTGVGNPDLETPSPASVLNVRLNASASVPAGDVTMSLTSVNVYR
jgi:hypothetical protein